MGNWEDGTNINRTTPVQVIGLSGKTITAVYAGYSYSLALASNGTVWAWGSNNGGQLGDNSISNRNAPVQVTALSGKTITALSAGGSHSLALASDGTVWAWGWNYYGQLGNGTTTNSTAPVQVTGPSGKTITAISTGEYYCLALASDGTVWAWGNNSGGLLGDGTATARTTPVQVNGLSDKTITAISAGLSHSMALASDGTVWAWGRNNYGQLGYGNITYSLSPVQAAFPSGNTVTALYGKGEHSLAVTSDGTVWAWGYNNYGQLGDGTTSNRNTPGQACGATTGKYTVTPLADVSYTSGSESGITTMTVSSGISGLIYFPVEIVRAKMHFGKECLVFVHLRDNEQINLNVLQADFDTVSSGKAGFNVTAGDIIKAYLVDDITNATDFASTILQ